MIRRRRGPQERTRPARRAKLSLLGSLDTASSNLPHEHLLFPDFIPIKEEGKNQDEMSRKKEFVRGKRRLGRLRDLDAEVKLTLEENFRVAAHFFNPPEEEGGEPLSLEKGEE